ncbi:MAG TPA: CPBP family intramembrane metalloprotease [Polyangiaceae bacterium]|nr:CPBP family intramembrane metalloprotease [Polyangiaceae bacterium]
MQTTADRPVREALLVYAAVAVATAVITRLVAFLPGLSSYVQLLVGATFLLAAVRLARREPGGMRRYGINLAGMMSPPDADDERPPGPLGLYDLARAMRDAAPSALRESAVAIGIAAVVFPPFVIGFFYWYQPSQPFALALPDELGPFVLTQLLVVALPEEAFFRGYMQTRLSDRWPPKGSPLGVDLRVLVLQAALFAMVHLVADFNLGKLAVFFPALLFGLLRARRGGIGAALLLHALSNLLAATLEASWQLR